MSLKLIKLQIKIFSALAIGSEEAIIIVNRRAKSSLRDIENTMLSSQLQI